jgi:arabinofuranosyltransferase
MRTPGSSRFSLTFNKYRPDLFGLLWVPYALLVYRFWFVTDDAFISFRFARNLALGHGLRYNLGEHTPVEGYSNFLWVMICAIFEFFRMEITLWPALLSAACGTVLLWLVFDLLHRRLELNLVVASLATLSLGCFPPFALWSTSGLATMPFALLVFVTFERLILRREGPAGITGGIAGLLLALIRVEGVAWALVILLLAIISRRIARQPSLREFVRFALIVGIGYAIYFAWRYSYYQMPLPNTVYAKALLDASHFMRGVNYVVTHELTFLTPILIIPGSLIALRRTRLAVGLPVAALAWGFPVYSILATGDHMAMGRFLVPGFAFNTILLAWMLIDIWERRWSRRAAAVLGTAIVITLGLLPGWNEHLVPVSVRDKFRFRSKLGPLMSEFERWQDQVKKSGNWTATGLALRDYVAQMKAPDPNPSIVADGIGAIGYYSGLFVYDAPGLVTPDVATRELRPGEPTRLPGHDKRVTVPFFLKYEPTILDFKLVRDADERELARQCARWGGLLRNSPPRFGVAKLYVLDFARVGKPTGSGRADYILVWRRIPEGMNWRQAWQAIDARVNALRQPHTESRPAPQPAP